MQTAYQHQFGTMLSSAHPRQVFAVTPHVEGHHPVRKISQDICDGRYFPAGQVYLLHRNFTRGIEYLLIQARQVKKINSIIRQRPEILPR
jgi:hypothetical protein